MRVAMGVAKSGAARGNVYLMSFVAAVILILTGIFSVAFAHGPNDGPNSAAAANNTTTPAAKHDSTSASADPIDAGYSAKIKEYTTEPDLLTELVDHLPASDTVPSPEKILGYVIGAPNKLTYTKDIYRYYRALAAASPRVKVFTVGKSEEGRDFMLVAVSDESNINQLDHLKDITARLADPRKITDADAQQLISTGKPFYWASGSIHSPETGSPEMLMELAYRLAVEDSPYIQKIRKNLVFLITPVLEVDGRDRMVDLYNYRKANPDKPAPNLIYWGHYVGHDNNRDNISMALQLSKVQMKNFLEWHPQVLHDLHESIPYLYTMTGTGPYNAWLDPIVFSEFQEMAHYEVEQFTKRGVPGVWTHGFYDGWAPNYMLYVATGHNSIGRFYETFGNGGADTRVRTLPPSDTSREWYRENPPLPKITWSMRDNTNMQESGLLFALGYTADHAQEFLSNFYLKSKRAVAKATTEGPAAWVIVNDGRRPTLQVRLARLLQQQGIEVDRIDREFEAKPSTERSKSRAMAEDASGEAKPESASRMNPDGGEKSREKKSEAASPVKIPAGSYVVRMDQPYSRMADMLLDTQYFNVKDPTPYDDTGWTMGPLTNVKTLRITDTAILKAPMTLVADPAPFSGKLESAGVGSFFLVDANAVPSLATLRFRLKDVKMFAAEEPFESSSAKYAAGSFIIPADGNPSDLKDQLEAAAKDLGLTIRAGSVDSKIARHEISVPRIALLHTWTNTQGEGWFRLALDETKIPYSYISDQVVRDTSDLRAKYDVIIFPPAAFNLSSLLNGIPKRETPDGSDFGGAIPWETTALTPNLGILDHTADIRGGMGLEGAAHIQKFIEDGGLFIPVSSSTMLPIDLGITSGVSIVPTHQLQARGSIFNAKVEDKGSPISYGYDDTVPVYFSQAPVFRVSVAPTGGFGGGEGGEANEGRPSGRGSVTDPDIPQGRPWNPQSAEPHRTRAEQETYISPDVREAMRGMIPPYTMWPRVVIRFADESNLWVSGMLAGGNELANAPAVVDVPVGRGHVVLFANNPMWRQETHGTFMLLLNAALNYDHLGVGRKAPPPPKDDIPPPPAAAASGSLE
ncbi:MAG TPA: M14 family zinc carboxypeptidase [Candidatus Limnocylindrales bacterium]|nr:M14 family zinc carboxypeptidase [Candidatus Limnocylindrales bacterium]